MEKIDGTEPAMPLTWKTDDDFVRPGLSIRQHFAAMAMAAYNANSESWNVDVKDKARWSVDDADALIAELNKTETK